MVIRQMSKFSYLCGTTPGFMLLGVEYNLGICLSWKHRLHSVEPADPMVSSGRHSKHVLQQRNSKDINFEWKDDILSRTACCSNSGSCVPNSICETTHTYMLSLFIAF